MQDFIDNDYWLLAAGYWQHMKELYSYVSDKLPEAKSQRPEAVMVTSPWFCTLASIMYT